MTAAAGAIMEVDDLFTNVVVQQFTSSGTWTKPAGAQRVRVQCWGGGGAGGGAAATGTNQASCGHGGQGGGYAESWFDASSLAASETVTIGAGGTGGTGEGPDGGNTTFSSGGNLVQGGGGNGGGVTSALGSLGVTSPSGVTQTNVGAITCRGGVGGYGIRNYGGINSGVGVGGVGGCAPGMGGSGANGANSAGGSAEANSGGGGGGAGLNANQSAANGGNGGSGRCIVTTYI